MPTVQDYLLKLAPDFSIFEMVEKYFYDNNLSNGILKTIFLYDEPSSNFKITTFHRAMFKVHTSGTVITTNLANDEYSVIPYKTNQIIVTLGNSPSSDDFPINEYIILAWGDSPIQINSNDTIDLILGVAF
jgi:hypothetical protein